MKFACVVLLACVAVSSAAFTGSLVQHVQPAVDNALFSLRLATSNKVTIPAVQQIIDHIGNTVNQLVANAQAALQQGQQMSQALVQLLRGFAAQLQTIGGQAAQGLQNAIQNLLASAGQIMPIGNKLDLANVITTLQAAINQAHGLAQELIAQAGNLPALVQQAVNSVLANFPQLAQLINAQLGLSQKAGLGDLFGELFGNIVQQVSGAVSNVGQQIAAAAQQIAQLGQQAFTSVQEQASLFVQNVQAGASHLSSQAATQILSHIGDFQEALGSQYQAVVESLNSVVINGN